MKEGPGSLPLCLANATSLVGLTLAVNSFSGSIPGTYFAAMKKLLLLNVASNRLTGTLPESLAQAVQLGAAKFSANSFTGRHALRQTEGFFSYICHSHILCSVSHLFSIYCSH